MIGFIAGSFDVIHPGYIYMFEEASSKCDYLVVGLHEDPSVERPEKIKPILSVEERKKILTSIRYIDFVVTYQTEDDLIKILKDLKPDVRFLGDDYKDKKITGGDLEIELCYLDRSHGWSTTKFKKEISNQFK
jgi:glycerol-3-phosphate cytidylyltransferase